ncbi:MAG: MBL fold metallo-hydrolase [Chloroflexaceae bacterium]|nr:MBL fold metallo-hydrolase [Chloroflexaceae bacterium]
MGQATLHVYHTPGHIDDMICFAVDGDPTIIVGDTVFAGGPGKTWSADGFQTTLRVLREVVLAWPAESICYPGHGPAFRLGDKHAAIADFVNRQHAAGFFGDATW